MNDKVTMDLIETNETVLRANLMNPPQLTPTGKISHAKTRVYTQRYRKAWELMPDFKGWLTSVPDQPTRAFCTYCSKNLHAHRLSLLKHTCTMKHQRCALMHQRETNAKTGAAAKEEKVATIKVQQEDESDMEVVTLDESGPIQDDDETQEGGDTDVDDEEIEYVVERLDEDMEDSALKVEEDEEYHQEDNYDDQTPVSRKIKVKGTDTKCHDALAEAMAHVHGEYLDENGDPVNVELEMVIESVDSENREVQSASSRLNAESKHNQSAEVAQGTENCSEYLRDQEKANQCETSIEDGAMATLDAKSSLICESSDATSDMEETAPEELLQTPLSMPLRQGYLTKRSTSRTVPSTTTMNSVTLTPIKKKTITLTSGPKSVTLNASAIKPYTGNARYLLNKRKGLSAAKVVDTHSLMVTEQTQGTGQSKIIQPQEVVEATYATPGTSQLQNPKKNTAAKSTKAVSTKKPCISTHVLDTSKGLPVGGLQISLYKLMDGRWTFVNESNTTPDGRCTDLIDTTKYPFTAGRYKLHFDVDKYFTLRRIETMYPFIEIIFDVKNPSEHYHMPVLLSPFGYTTYRGS